MSLTLHLKLWTSRATRSRLYDPCLRSKTNNCSSFYNYQARNLPKQVFQFLKPTKLEAYQARNLPPTGGKKTGKTHNKKQNHRNHTFFFKTTETKHTKPHAHANATYTQLSIRTIVVRLGNCNSFMGCCAAWSESQPFHIASAFGVYSSCEQQRALAPIGFCKPLNIA